MDSIVNRVWIWLFTEYGMDCLQSMEWIVDNVITCWYIVGQLSSKKWRSCYDYYYNVGRWIPYTHLPNSYSSKDSKKTFIDPFHY